MSKFTKPDLRQNTIKSGEQAADYIGDSKSLYEVVQRIESAPSMKSGGYLTSEGNRFNRTTNVNE